MLARKVMNLIDSRVCQDYLSEEEFRKLSIRGRSPVLDWLGSGSACKAVDWFSWTGRFGPRFQGVLREVPFFTRVVVWRNNRRLLGERYRDFTLDHIGS